MFRQCYHHGNYHGRYRASGYQNGALTKEKFARSKR